MAGPSRDYDRVELVWPGKRAEVERVRLPFQTIERVSDAGRAREAQAPMLTGATDLPDWWPDGWRNKLIWGDNKYVLASLLDEFRRQGGPDLHRSPIRHGRGLHLPSSSRGSRVRQASDCG